MTIKEDILEIVRNFPEGIGVPYIRETLRVSDSVVRYHLGRLVTEGLVREEEEFIFRRPYYWFWTYYPVEVPVPPPPPPPPVVEYIHTTLVYNVKTEDTAGREIDISLTYDFDCKDMKEIKDTLKQFLFTKSHFWLEAKFGTQMPRAAEWAETEEKPSDSEVVTQLIEDNLSFTALHFKWSYWRAFGNKSEELEGDLEDWEDDVPIVISYYDVKKGRKRKVG